MLADVIHRAIRKILVVLVLLHFAIEDFSLRTYPLAQLLLLRGFWIAAETITNLHTCTITQILLRCKYYDND